MSERETIRVAYADPPYPGMAHYYKDHPDYAGEVDHAELVQRLEADYDGWVLHTASTTLKWVLEVCPDDARVGAWVKPFASFKKGIPIAYAWEPVIFKGGRRRNTSRQDDASMATLTVRDWIAEPITLKRGLTGAKPQAVCFWLFEVMGLEPHDDLDDLFPGSGAVSAAWQAWTAQGRLAA